MMRVAISQPTMQWRVEDHLREVEASLSGTRLVFREGQVSHEITSELLGRYNALNLVAAFAAVRALGFATEEVLETIEQVAGAPGRFERVDVGLPGTTLAKDHITAELRRLIEENQPVGATWITDDEMAAKPDLVRTMSVKPPMGTGRVRVMEVEGVDLQPCGGTHVRATGEIGRVRVGKIEKKGRHNRRVNVLFDE